MKQKLGALPGHQDIADKAHFNAMVGQRIKQLREERGLQRCDLTRLLRCGSTTLQKAEDGDAALATYYLVQLAEVFDVTLDEMVPLDATPKMKDEPARQPLKDQDSWRQTGCTNEELYKRLRKKLTSDVVKPGQVWSYEEGTGERVTVEVIELQMTENGPKARCRKPGAKRYVFCPLSRFLQGKMGARLERDAA